MIETEQVVDVPEAPALPGLRFRRYAGEADVPEMVRVSLAVRAADDWQEHVTTETVANDLAYPTTIASTEGATLAEVDGTLVAYSRIDIEDGTANERLYHLFGYVHPEWRRRGIGRALLALAERELRERAAAEAGAVGSRERFLESWAPNGNAGAVVLLEGAGYSAVRWFFEMVRPTLDDIRDFPLPPNLEIRPVSPQDWRRIFDADIEAFRDHWGGLDGSDSSYRRWISEPYFDPSLWVVAWDGDEPAGAVINSIFAAENEAYGFRRGWLDSVWVRRPWRGRGLARALVSQSLHVLREHGMESAILGVDADNPTGALGVYTANGFVVHKRSTAYRKPIGW